MSTPLIETSTAPKQKITLQDFILSGKKLPWRIRMRILMEVALQLAALHEQGLVHGDIGSWNIFLDEELHATLGGLDTVIALEPGKDHSIKKRPVTRQIISRDGLNSDSDDEPEITIQDQATAPEILQSGRYSEKSDIFAYGILLIQLIKYRQPGSNGYARTTVSLPANRPDGLRVWRENLPINCPRLLITLAEACIRPLPELRFDSKAVNTQLEACYNKDFRGMVTSIPFANTIKLDDTSDKISLDDLLNLTSAQKVGQGKHGAVYLGQWNGQNAAIKVPLYEEENFTREANIQINLDHENIVKLFTVCYTPTNKPCLVMEWASKGSVHDLLHNPAEHLDWATRLLWAADISAGLAYLHQRRIILYGLRADNVVVDGDGHAKLCDFGKAAYQSINKDYLDLDPPRTSERSSPEVISYSMFSLKSDIYNMGVVFFELISGKTPVEAPEMFPATSGNWRAHLPEDCPSEFIELALDCQNQWPTERPDAEAVHTGIIDCMKKHGFFRSTAKAAAVITPTEAKMPSTLTLC
jgi:serine/threonine protein kinase